MVKRTERLRIAFCHPDLGLGGAERLVVDAACELCDHGHKVDVYTAYYDRSRCFKETLTGQFSVTVAGGWFPRTIANRAHAFCAYVRCMLVAVWVAIIALRRDKAYDVIFVDQVSAAIPVLLLLTRSKVLFYCHFPDLLLAQKSSGIRRLYRAPLNAVEELTTGQAHHILVNSKYTQGIFGETFKRLNRQGKVPNVFYPAVPIPTDAQLQHMHSSWRDVLKPEVAAFMKGKRVFLSINRFERKKKLGLAVKGFKAVLADRGNAPGVCPEPGLGSQRIHGHTEGHSREREVFGIVLVTAGGYDKRLADNSGQHKDLVDLKDANLVQNLGLAVRGFRAMLTDHAETPGVSKSVVVIAGGYDKRLAENREHYGELGDLIAEYSLQDKVILVQSFTDAERSALLAAACAVVYTPTNEHFGIVPLEAMAAGRPVLACNSGGPKETVLHGRTGFLAEPQPKAFAAAMAQLADPEKTESMGRVAREHVRQTFSRQAFGKRLDDLVRQLAAIA